MKLKILFLFLAFTCFSLSSCSMSNNRHSEGFDFMPYEKKNGYFYTADRNVKTATDGFLISGGINNVRLSDANGGI